MTPDEFRNGFESVRVVNEPTAAKHAIDIDKAIEPAGFGEKTKNWLKAIGSKLGDAGFKIGTGAAQELVKQWVLQYFGLK